MGNMKTKNRIYLSGKITGLHIEGADNHFNKAEEKLNQCGYEVINPMNINHDHDKSWENYMRVDLKALLDCDFIYMLKNWHLSKGANIEYNLAKDLGLTIIFE